MFLIQERKKPKVSQQELTQYEQDEKVFTQEAMENKYGLGDFDEWAHKVLFRFDGRPDGIKDYLSHDVYRITDPSWLDFLSSSKYELLDDDPTMIWEDSESHETWVLFDSRLVPKGEHLNKTENQLVAHSVEIKTQSSPKNQQVGKWQTLSVGTHTCLTRYEAAVIECTKHFRVERLFIEKQLVIHEEYQKYGVYYLDHMGITYYIHVDQLPQ